MTQKILVAQSIEELEYLILNINFFFRVLPLNLKTQIYCVEKKIDFIDLSIAREIAIELKTSF